VQLPVLNFFHLYSCHYLPEIFLVASVLVHFEKKRKRGKNETPKYDLHFVLPCHFIISSV